jgi:hypothetical protein
VKRQTGGSQQPWVSSSPIDGNFYFVAPAPAAASQQLAPRHAEPLASTLRPDPDRIPIKDPVLLRELSDRLFELNYDPEPLDSKNGMRAGDRQVSGQGQDDAEGEPPKAC